MIEKESTGDTKGKILDVAQDLIQRFGLNAMSFQHLSDAVGIKKSSVHHHFPSKDLMVNACLLYTSPSPRDGLLSRMPSSA